MAAESSSSSSAPAPAPAPAPVPAPAPDPAPAPVSAPPPPPPPAPASSSSLQRVVKKLSSVLHIHRRIGRVGIWIGGTFRNRYNCYEGGNKPERITSAGSFSMENLLGLLRIRIWRGVNLVVRDTVSSDPYVVVTMGNQKLKTRVVKKNCNPEWNDELTLSVCDPNVPILLAVFDKDTLTGDDEMGDAEIDLKPYMKAMEMGLEDLPTPTTISRVQPDRENCLVEESPIIWQNGKIVQDMVLRLRNVDTGEIELQIEWIELPSRA